MSSVRRKLTVEKVSALLSAMRVNELINSETVNGLVTAERVNGLVTAEKVNSLVAAEKVNSLVSSEKVNSLVAAERVNELITAERVNELLDSDIAAGDVGSYALLAHKDEGDGGSAGDLFDGAGLAYAGFQTSAGGASWSNAYPIPVAGSVEGQWRLMGTTVITGSDDRLRASLFKRIS